MPPGAHEGNGSFLAADEVVNILLAEDSVVDCLCTELPKGRKENVYFVVDNNENIKRRNSGGKSKFPDDCGAWSDSSSTKKHHYVFENGSLVYIELKNKLFCKYSKGEKRPLDPQPKMDDVLILKRYYTSLKRAPDYKKRVTWVEKYPTNNRENSKCIAVVEYIGIFPQNVVPHGNAKHCNADYVRSSDAVKTKLTEKVKNNNGSLLAPRKIYEEMVLEDPENAPRDLKQVQNVKYLENKKNRHQTNTEHRRKNIADDVLSLLNMFHEHPFVQEIIQTKGKPPSVILYLKEQLQEIRTFCSSDTTHQSVLGVDRTFNLGPCYVTILVYHQANLIRKGTQNHPIMLGPVFLHWDGLYQTYHRFFSHLQSQFDDCICSIQASGRHLLLGSDEEKAMTKAMKQCFPLSHHILCRRHIEDNVKRHLCAKIGINDSKIKEIIGDIFGENGLISCADEYEFQLAAFELEEKYSKSIPKFLPYFVRLTKSLLEFVFLPSKKNNCVPIDWKNNSCESMNHILKLSCNWKVQKMTDLVEKIFKIVKLQYADMKRALYGMGNFQIAPWMAACKVSQTNWAAKSEEEKDKLFQKFLKGVPKKEKKVKSTDGGRLEIPTTQKVARKPGQRKRIKSVRTR